MFDDMFLETVKWIIVFGILKNVSTLAIEKKKLNMNMFIVFILKMKTITQLLQRGLLNTICQMPLQ